MKILNKQPKDHANFLKAYKLFAYHHDNLEMIKRISTKTLIMTGSEDCWLYSQLCLNAYLMI